MTARVLDFTEWHRLPEHMDAVLMDANPVRSRMCVVEDDQGQIVARWLLYPALMAEDAWVDPAYRKNPAVARKLWSLVHESARDLGHRHLLSASMSAESDEILAHPSVRAEQAPPMVVFPVKE